MEATPAPTPMQESQPSHTLLYVEDTPSNLQLIEQLIARRTDLKSQTADAGGAPSSAGVQRYHR